MALQPLRFWLFFSVPVFFLALEALCFQLVHKTCGSRVADVQPALEKRG